MNFTTRRLAAITLVLAAGQLSAHDLRLSSVAISDDPSGAAMVVSMPLSELARAERGRGTASLTPLEIDAAIRRRLKLQPASSSVSIESAADLLTWRADFPVRAADIVIHDRLIPELPLTYTRVRTIGANGASHEIWLGTPAPRYQPGVVQTLLNFFRMGFAHVLDGPDHIAFILGLILLGGSLRSLVFTVTAFTMAHSITLGLAAAGIVAPSPRVIEPLIALSIVAIAAENLLHRGSLARRPCYAFAFGLVHGFGLADPLREMAAPGAWFGLSLIPFNIGVEFAQGAIVVAVWPALRWLLRRSPAAMSRVAFTTSCVIGLAGAYWFADRVSLTGLAFAQSTESPDSVAARVEASFRPFAPRVTTRYDAQFFYVESDGMPEHRMMVGITAWQQQVPLPQPYRGENAWRFPLFARPAVTPLSAKEHFFRGAIAIAANGIPIFNPIKNDGHTDTFLAGELDEFGGHGGRADDYHYHLPPLHLQKTLGNTLPIAYALDGYPIYGLTDPDGSSPRDLDAFNGHTANVGYHYHATKTYPYLNGGFHGEVTEIEGQVDPQPRTDPVRPSGDPLRGATVSDFEKLADNEFRLTYRLRGETWHIHYTINRDGTYTFDYIDGRGNTRSESYVRRRGRGGRGR
jgi:hydrogenase/urease accessory protein HupE